MPRKSIAAEVDRLLKANGIGKAPIDVEQIANSLGAFVSFEPFEEGLSGVCIKEAARVVIGVNSSHARSRQRFTIAHEIGHLVLAHVGELFIDRTVMRRDTRSSQASDRQEVEANQFAAELLMPSDFVEAALSELERRYGRLAPKATIQEMADQFQVSPQAMEYRLANLGMYMLR